MPPTRTTVPGKLHPVADVGSVNFDPTVLPGGQWFLLDTYPLEGYQHLVLFSLPSAGSLCRWPS